METAPVSRSPETDSHLADLTEWFCGFGFDRDEAETKAFSWMNEEGTLCLAARP